jgi:hypothetical protein
MGRAVCTRRFSKDREMGSFDFSHCGYQEKSIEDISERLPPYLVMQRNHF